MNHNDRLNQLIHDALNSLDNAGRATPKPYLLTRIHARMQNEKENLWDKTLGFISKPAVAMVSIALVIAINAMVITYTLPAKNNSVSDEQFTTDDEFNTNVATLNYFENIEQNEYANKK